MQNPIINTRVSSYELVYSVRLHSNWAKYGTAAGQIGPHLRRRRCQSATQKAIIIIEVVIMAIVRSVMRIEGGDNCGEDCGDNLCSNWMSR
jgi:hypothetical protein